MCLSNVSFFFGWGDVLWFCEQMSRQTGHIKSNHWMESHVEKVVSVFRCVNQLNIPSLDVCMCVIHVIYCAIFNKHTESFPIGKLLTKACYKHSNTLAQYFTNGWNIRHYVDGPFFIVATFHELWMCLWISEFSGWDHWVTWNITILMIIWPSNNFPNTSSCQLTVTSEVVCFRAVRFDEFIQQHEP